MTDIIRTFSAVSCLVSALYSIAMCIYFKKDKNYLWFGVACVGLFLNVSQRACADLDLLNEAAGSGNLSGCLFLVSYSMATLCINMYTGFAYYSKSSRYHTLFNALCMLFAASSLVVPAKYAVFLYIFLCFLACMSYIFSIRSFIVLMKDSPAYYYSLIANSLMLLGAVANIVLAILGISLFDSRLVLVPVYLILHIVMFTKQYRLSIKSTQELTGSLHETIDRINHSDNALMCTQMKSDFLYKSLELISQKCDEDPWDAEDLTISLSKYLRHTLNFQQLKGIVPLSNELELTKAFVAIERERYPFVTFEYNIPNPIPEFHIPPLSIQPLVENSISHAFIKKKDGAKISITIIPYKDYYHIDVTDNGDGMDEDTAGSLTDSLHDSARVGVYSIHTRLLNLFGKGLVIQSAPGVGTSISFVVPPDTSSINEESEAGV